MSLDHGELNLPLSKRGITEAEIDRNLARIKRAKEGEWREAARENVRLRAEAKAFVAELTEERVAEIATRSRMGPKATRKSLMSIAHWEPRKVLAWKSQEGGPA